ncbi:hypothetical protein JTB14_003511 [Gonioctena quinquepunctata]|nr:hypothetical protein JTB14_003511 [Gonioctena quinquepunctata]
MPNTKVTDVDSCAERDEYKKATLPIPPKVQGKIKKREKEIKSDNTKGRKFTTKMKKSNPTKEMQMILRNNIQKQRHQIEETALQVNGDATDEQEALSIVSLSSDLEEHSFSVSNSEKTPEDIVNQKSLLEELETAQIMREDEVMALIRYDELIISYGNALCTKYRLEHMRPMIRTRLRLIGRFLLEIKKINEGVTDFASVFTPDRFDAAVEAINALAGLDKTKQEYKSPSTAFEMGSQLKKCGKHLITMCIKSKDKNRKTEVQDFLKILEEELAVCINKTVMENQLQHKRLKKINLPTSQNIAGFNNYLNKKRQLFHKKLEAAFDYNDWEKNWHLSP